MTSASNTCREIWRQRREVRLTTWLGASLLLASGCAEPAFSVHTLDNELKTLQPVLTRLRAAAPAPTDKASEHAMAYVYAGPERRGDKDLGQAEKTLYGYDLSAGRLIFATPADVRSRFVATDGVLAHREGASEIVLRDAKAGTVRARVALAEGETLAGLAGDGGRIYYVTRVQADRQKGETGNRSFVTALDSNGQRLWRLPAPGTVGAPAATGGLLAVPFRYQELVVLDGQSGNELTRIRQKDEQIGFVRAAPGGFYYGVGDKGLALLSESSVKAEKGAIAYAEPKLGERVRVFLNWDGYRPEQTHFSAFDRNRLLWDAVPTGDKLAFTDGQAVLHSYRFFFDAETAGGRVRWAYAHPRQNIMSSELSRDAVLFVAQDGELGALDRRSGARVFAARLELKPGQQVLGATFDTAAGAAQVASAGHEVKPLPPVLDVLHSIIFDKDSSFISVKLFAIQTLGSLSGRDAAAELLRIVTAEGLPSPLAKAAGEVLVARRDADTADLLLSALKQNYDFLEDRRPRGIDILAKVAAAVAAKETVPALAERLLDPNTPAAALKDIVAALTDLGGTGSSRALRDLLLLYRADVSFQTDLDPLRKAGEGLLKLEGESGRRTLLYVSLEPRTLPALSNHFQKLLSDPPARRPAPAKGR